MINTIKKAVERITWRMSNGWKSNDTDIEAINFIVDFVNITLKENLRQNELFAKLYIWSYSRFLKKYNATVFDSIPQKELNKMLSKPIESFIESFKEQLNKSELYTIFDLAGIKDFDHIHISHIEAFYKDMGYSDDIVKEKTSKIIDDRKKSNEKLEDLLKKHPEIMGYIYKGKEIWDYETIKENLERDINNCLIIHAKKD